MDLFQQDYGAESPAAVHDRPPSADDQHHLQDQPAAAATAAAIAHAQAQVQVQVHPHPHSHSHPHPHPHSQDVIPSDSSMPSDAAPGSEPNMRGKAATHGMSALEKKERQKQQNRRAAERSRNKKREELTALEMTVNNIQEENNRLRARLSVLLESRQADAQLTTNEVDGLASGAGESSSSGVGGTGAGPLPEANPGGAAVASSLSVQGVDYTVLAELQSELASVRSTLLGRELELSRLRNSSGAEGSRSPGSGSVKASRPDETGTNGARDGLDQPSPDVDGDADSAERDLQASSAALQVAQSEVKSLHSVINHMRSERDTLSRQRDALSREIEARRTLREAAEEAPSLSTTSRAGGTERALLELRGLVDGVIKQWERTSVLGMGMERSGLEDK